MGAAEVLVTVLGTGGVGAILLALIKGASSWLSGGASRERARNASYLEQRTSAITERDEMAEERESEAARRRTAEEYAALLRRQLIEAGIQPHTAPPTEKESK